jgi:hypothetical protein
MKLSDLWKRHGFLLIAVLAIIIVIIASVSIAKAATSATITWVHPTTYTDGTALDVADIKETVIIWRRPGSTSVVGSVRVASPATSKVVSGLTCGSFNITAATVATSSVSSAETAPVLYVTGVVCSPNPPTTLKVT